MDMIKKLIVCVLLLLIPLSNSYAEWESPTEKKYKNKNQILYKKYIEARGLLNKWRGQREYLKSAKKILDEIIGSDNKFALAHREYGRFYVMAGMANSISRKELVNPAEASILKAIELEPDYADAYVLLGHVYTRLKQYHKAEITLKKAERIGTQLPWLHLNFATLYRKQGKLDDAFERFMLVVNSDTKNKKAYASALSGVKLYHLQKGDYEEADKWYVREIEYEPESAWSWGNYASFLLTDRNDVDGAIFHAEKALSIMSYRLARETLATALYVKWGMMLADGSSKDDVQHLFDKAYSLNPNINELIPVISFYPYTSVATPYLKEYLMSGK